MDEHPIEPEGVGAVTAALVDGWRIELKSAARSFLAGGAATGELEVAIQDGLVSLRWLTAGSAFDIARIARNEDDPARAMRSALTRAAEIVGERRDAVLILSAGDVLRPAVTLPQASQRNLHSALRYELERLSPVAPDEVYFDFALTGRDRTAKTVQAELRIIRREIVDQAIETCIAAGLAIGEIRFAGDARKADHGAFPVDRNAFLRGLWRRWNIGFLAGLAVFMVLAVLIGAYWRGASAQDMLTDQLVDEGVRAAHVEHLQSRIDQVAAQMAFLGRQKQAPDFAAILAAVTRTLPDGTWISEFDLTGNRIRIDGFSKSASDLIAIFDRSGRFTNAQFAAPVTQGNAPGVERFDLTFEIAGRKS